MVSKLGLDLGDHCTNKAGTSSGVLFGQILSGLPNDPLLKTKQPRAFIRLAAVKFKLVEAVDYLQLD